MFWLFALATLAVSALTGGSKPRRDPNSPIDETMLVPYERDELRQLEQRHAHAVSESERLNAELAHAESEVERLNARVGNSYLISFLVGVGHLGAGFVAFALTHQSYEVSVRIAFAYVMTVPLYWMFVVPFVRGRRAERADAVDERDSCRAAAARAQVNLGEVTKMIPDTRARLHALADERAETRRREDEERTRALERERAWERSADSMKAFLEAYAGVPAKRRQEQDAFQAEMERLDLIGFIKSAFTHWRTVARNPDAYVAIHAERLIAQEEKIVGSYANGGAMGATADDCVRLAARALAEFPQEVAYWMRNPADRTVAKIAYVFRRYTGDFRERLLPAAYEHVHGRGQAKADSVSVSSAPARREIPLATEGPLADLPPEDQREISELLRDIRALEVLDQVLELESQSYEQRLRRRTPPPSEEQIARAMEKYNANLDKLRRDWAATKDMTA